MNQPLPVRLPPLLSIVARNRTEEWSPLEQDHQAESEADGGSKAAPQGEGSIDTGVDFLTSMPPEILSKIAKHFEGDRKGPGPICKALVPFLRPIPFLLVSCFTTKQLRSLLAILSVDPSLGAFCHRILFWSNFGKECSKTELAGIFELFINVKTIRIMKFTHAIELVLSSKIAKSCFPKLEILDLHHPTSPPFEAYQSLIHYPLLRELRILDLATVNTLGRTIPPNSRPQNLSSLNFHGDWHPAWAADFVKTMPHLKEFGLDVCNFEEQVLVATLKALPATLTSLCLVSEAENDDSNIIDEVISRLKALEKLSLSTDCFTSAIFAKLKDPLPLTELQFGPATKEVLHQDNLIKLLDPKSSYHNSSLKYLNLSNLHGPSIDANGEVSPNRSEAEFLQIYKDRIMWVKAQMEYKGVKLIASLGEEQGVNVYGSTIGLLRVQDLLDKNSPGALAE